MGMASVNTVALSMCFSRKKSVKGVCAYFPLRGAAEEVRTKLLSLAAKMEPLCLTNAERKSKA